VRFYHTHHISGDSRNCRDLLTTIQSDLGAYKTMMESLQTESSTVVNTLGDVKAGILDLKSQNEESDQSSSTSSLFSL
jgi:hypothetical protein